jgi:hypothetical protein
MILRPFERIKAAVTKAAERIKESIRGGRKLNPFRPLGIDAAIREDKRKADITRLLMRPFFARRRIQPNRNIRRRIEHRKRRQQMANESRRINWGLLK